MSAGSPISHCEAQPNKIATIIFKLSDHCRSSFIQKKESQFHDLINKHLLLKLMYFGIWEAVVIMVSSESALYRHFESTCTNNMTQKIIEIDM